MNKKKVSLIVVGVLVLLLAIYLAFNPAWITHPKYMLDKQYCEQDSDCRFNNCEGISNLYNEKKGVSELGNACLNEFCGTTCNQNKCIYMRCGEK